MAPKFHPAISSMSLGRAWNHTLEAKLGALSKTSIRGIELFHEDLEYVARSLPSSHPALPPSTSFPTSTAWDEAQLAAASYIHTLCSSLDITIICLQPFMHYEGLTSATEHASRLTKLRLWFRLAHILHTDLIQIPSNFLPAADCTSDRHRIVADLIEVAELGLQQSPVIRFAYEALCWGTHIDGWDQGWQVVKAVDRPNFGTCLDTFNIVGRMWGDPTSVTGKTEYADVALALSMANLERKLTKDNRLLEKLFYIEVVDAERLSAPLVEGQHDWFVPSQKPRMTWSRNARLFPFEEGGYLPILEVLRVVLQAGYEGWVSFELFNRSMNAEGGEVPGLHAQRAEVSWRRLGREMGWWSDEEGKDEEEEMEGAGGVERDGEGKNEESNLPISRIRRKRPTPTTSDEWGSGDEAAVARL